MSKTYLTDDEIYMIDRLDEISFSTYISALPPEKAKLVSHIFAKNRANRVIEHLFVKETEFNEKLIKLLEENNIEYKQ